MPISLKELREQVEEPEEITLSALREQVDVPRETLAEPDIPESFAITPEPLTTKGRAFGVAEPTDLRVDIPRFPREFDPESIMSQLGLGLSPEQKLALNLAAGGVELQANIPSFLLDLISRPGQLAPVKEGKAQIPPILKDIVDPAAKLAAGLTVESESEAGRRFFEEVAGETFERPEQALMPLLVGVGGAKGVTGVGRAVRGTGKLLKDVIRPTREKVAAEPVEAVKPIKAIDEFLKPKGEPKPPEPTPELVKVKPKAKKKPKPVKAKLIGLKKAEIAKLRKETGLDKLPEVERKTWETSLKKAKESKLDESATQTADEVLQSKRIITDEEHAGMVIRAAKLADEYDASIAKTSDLIKKGDVGAAEFERIRSETLINEFNKITEASDLGGREAARALSIRRMMVNRETFELAPVMQRATAAKGSKLTPTETTKIQQSVKRYKDVKTKYDQLLKDHEKTLADLEKTNADKIVQRNQQRKVIGKRAAEAKQKLSGERDLLKKQLKELGIRVNDVTGITGEGAFLVGKLGINYIKQGARTLEEVVRLIKADVPDLTARDVYQALISKDPALQTKARSAATKSIAQLKTQAKLLLDIEKAERGIFEPGRQKTLQPREIRNLQRRLRDLRTEAYKSGMDTKRLEKSIRTINELQAQLDNQFRAIKKKQRPDTAELKTAKEKIELLRKTMRVEDDLAKLNDQLRTGEFEIREKPVPKEMPPELERKQAQLNIARKKVKASIEDMRPLTIRRGVSETVSTARTLKATADMSAVFRQGLVLTVKRPIKGAKAFGKAFKATFSELKAEEIDAAMRSADHHYIREKSGLHLPEIGDVKLNAREEMFMSRVAEKIPGVGRIVKASERHMVTYLNLMRSAAFDEFLAKYPNATAAELTAWADWVNIASGRGNLGRASAIANELSLAVFAPKFAVSRIQTPYQVFKHWREPRVRKMITRDYAALAVVGATTLGLADLAGFEVGLDPREPDWGKIKVGNTKIDIWGGLQQPMRVTTRIGLGLTDRIGITGAHLTEKEKEIDPLELVGQFSAYKASPLITVPLEFYKGKTIVGEPVTPTETAIKSVVPMVYEDIYEAYNDAGIPRALLAGGAAFFGVGASTYEDSRTRTRRQIRKFEGEDNYDAANQLRLEWNIKHPESKILGVKPIIISKPDSVINEK